jgi:hypothetical protein
MKYQTWYKAGNFNKIKKEQSQKQEACERLFHNTPRGGALDIKLDHASFNRRRT